MLKRKFIKIWDELNKKFIAAAQFKKYYFDAAKWCAAVLFLLLLPIICASLYDGFMDLEVDEKESFVSSFIYHINNYIKNGSFILVVIGLSGAAYIDYFFEYKFNRWETRVHLWFLAIIALSLIIYTVVYLFEFGESVEIGGKKYILDSDYVKFWSFILFTFAYVYSFFVKSILAEYRDVACLERF